MKEYKKSIVVKLFVFIILLATCMFSCSCNKPESSNVKEAFLTAYFTSNYNDRYETWLQYNANNNEQTEDKINEALTKYYTSVNNYISDELYKKMILNRDMMKSDKDAYDNGYVIYPTSFEFVEYSKFDDKTTYTFKAHLIKEISNESIAGSMEGQITEQQIGETIIITNLYLSDTGFVADN